MSDKTIADPLRGYRLRITAEYRNQTIQELIEKAGESDTHFPAWVVQDYKDMDRHGPPDNVLLSDWLKSQMEGGE